MYGLSYKLNISFEQGLSQLNHLEAWRLITAIPTLSLGDKFSSPIRPDNDPGCYLRLWNGIMFLTDWAFPEYNKFTAVHALAHINRSSLLEALELLLSHQKYGSMLEIGSQCILGGKRIVRSSMSSLHFETFLSGNTPTLRKEDLEFWSKRGITKEDLADERQPVFSVHHYQINQRIYYPETYPCFAYHFKDSSSTKLYCPNNDHEHRFPASSTTAEDVWSWNQNIQSDICVVTKSFKDGIELAKITALPVFAFQNEGVIPSRIQDINQRYPRKLVIYDNDSAGVNAAHKVSSKLDSATVMFYPEMLGKDTDDLVVAGHSRFILDAVNKHRYAATA